MRRLMLPAAALFFLLAAALPAAQKRYPIFTLADFVKMMKTVGQNFAGTTDSLAKNDFDTAKARLTRSRELLATTITFWRDHKKEDAVRMLRDTLARMDALDAALSAEAIDPADVKSRAQQVDAACEACHAVYREQDPGTKAYRLKPGSVE